MNRPAPRSALPFQLPLEGEDAELDRLKAKIHRERGFNCHFYKDRCLRRRIAVRMRVRGQTSVAGYAALLDRDPAEYDHLLDALTINVSKFFRNAEMWRVFAERVMPRLWEEGPPRRGIWSAGSASGEEAYTVSILLHEWAREGGGEAELDRFRIVGTDIDRGSLEAARAAVYPELALLETPAEIRERWFSPDAPFRLRAQAKRNVEFRRHDLISEEPEPGQSLILCRNVIIYFDRGTQERLFQRFYDALVPGGFLILGKVETLLGVTRGLFRPIDNRERVFQKPG